MKHAAADALETIEDLVAAIRKWPELKERKQGVFYRGSRACIHFHEDLTGIYCDLNLGERWRRLPVTTSHDQSALLELLLQIGCPDE
jgi:hypothetical protein